MPKKTPDQVVAEALRLIRTGASARAAAAQVAKKFHRPCSEAAVRVWVRKAKAEEVALLSTPEPEAAHVDAPHEPDADADDADLYDRTLKMINRAQARAERAEADGNHAAAQRAQRDAATLLPVLARLDKDRRASTDSVTFSREEFERADRAIDDRVAALISDLARTGGIVCSHCGREIRTALAKGD